MRRLPEQGKDIRDCYHVLELFGWRALCMVWMAVCGMGDTPAQ